MEAEQKKNPWQRLPTWGRWTIAVIGAFFLVGIGAAIGGSNEGNLEKEVSALEGQLANAKQGKSDAEAQASRVEALKGKIVGQGEARAASIVNDAKRESEEAKNALGSLKSEVASTEGELEEVEGSLSGAEHEAALSTISDGTWQAETDFIPGTYRAPGGPNCYWATLNSADPYDIASNENGTGPQIAAIEAPYFQTDGCGTWERIE